jgi:hypothetical protein
MLQTPAIQVLPAQTDRTTYFVSMQPTLSGRQTAVYSAPELNFRPFDNTLTTSGNIIVGGLVVNASATIASTLSVGAGIQNTPIGTITPSTAIFTSESISGNSTINALTVNASATVGGTLGVTSDLTVGGNLTINGTTTTVNQEIINTSLIDAGTLSVGANATVNALTVNNSATIGTTFRVSGATVTAAITASGTVQPNANASIDLGGTSTYWNNGYINSLNAPSITGRLQTAAQTNITSVGTLTGLTLSGTLTGTTINAATIGNSGATLTGTLSTAAQTNITSVGTLTGLTVSGTAQPNANASIDLGGTSAYWNNGYINSLNCPTITGGTFSGTSTTAKYADLAEYYSSQDAYPPGTVLDFGGPAEVTMSMTDMSIRVAGVVSTNPAYLMNSAWDGGGKTVALALTGRVPCLVTGNISAGDMMVSAGNGYARAESNPKMGSVIGKALTDFSGDSGVIEVVVGRL